VPHNVRVALIAFAGDPQVAAPPTTDLEVVRQGLDSLGYYSGYGGTAIGDAIAAAVDLVKPQNPNGTQTIAYTTIANAKRSPVSILFLSDGHQTRGLLQPLEGADRARAAGIPVYTIALGTPNGVLDLQAIGQGPGTIPVPPDPEALKAIAHETGGESFTALDASTLKRVYDHIGTRVSSTKQQKELTFLVAGLAAVLLAAAVGSSWVLRVT
jgi:Ca-activated chloride channel homolog